MDFVRSKVVKLKKKISILICYFGKFPWYFGYFIHSCKYNSKVDFLLVTDILIHIDLPSNVRVVNKSLNDIAERAEQKFGIPVVITDPYKLCDFKPAYGYIFSELIEGYDFWGYADIDVVFGNIRHFITDEILLNYDVISCRHDYLTGVFCLYRNCHQINTLFMQSKDYQKMLTRTDFFSFCECNFLWQELDNGASIFDFPNNIESMTWVVKKAAEEGKIKAHFDFIIAEGTPGKIKWDKGSIIYNNKYEAMLYHLVMFKTVCKKPRLLDPIPDTFYFSPSQIYK